MTRTSFGQVITTCTCARERRYWKRWGTSQVHELGPSHLDGQRGIRCSVGGKPKDQGEALLFRSHIDGSEHLFRPNVSWTSSAASGPTSFGLRRVPAVSIHDEYAKKSMELTHRWLHRCVTRMNETEPLYGHEQHVPDRAGSTYPDLRRASPSAVAEVPPWVRHRRVEGEPTRICTP